MLRCHKPHKKTCSSQYAVVVIPNSALPLHIQKQWTAKVSSWGLPLKAPGCTLGRVANKVSRQSSDACSNPSSVIVKSNEFIFIMTLEGLQASEGWQETWRPSPMCTQEPLVEDPKRTPWQCTASECIAGVHCWGSPWGKQIHGMWLSVYLFLGFSTYCTYHLLLGSSYYIYLMFSACSLCWFSCQSAKWLARNTPLMTPG